MRFGVFEVDLGAGELRKQGQKIKLQNQPFQLLQMLLEHPGEIVSREALRQRIWPVDTFVDFDQGLSNAVKRLRESLCDSVESPRFVETIPGRGYRFIASVGTPPGQIKSLAVLPLEDLSHHPEEEYFADGLTEALITNLAKISALHVVSRTSAMQYKGIRKSLREIARDLGADGIVEGTVLRSGERVRISAQLVNASTDMHIWAESYDRDLRDILALQSEVALAIAREIQAKLTPPEREQLARTRPVNPEAYEAYLKGRYHWNRRSGESFKKAADYFQQAIDKDPTYAAAHTGLADVLVSLSWWGFVSPDRGSVKGKAAALRALQIDSTLAEAHVSLAWAMMHYDWDFLGAEKEFQRAIELNPRYATAHQWYGHCLGCMGRFDESFAELKHAIRLEPLSLILNTSYAGFLWLARRWDQAIEQCQKTLELDANFQASRWILGQTYDSRGDHEAAINHLQTLVNTSGGAVIYLTRLGHAYGTAGRSAEARTVLRQLQEFSKHGYVMAYWMAYIFSALHDKDEAFHWLDKAYEERSAWMAFLKMDPWFDELRSDPRFQNLLRRVGFPT